MRARSLPVSDHELVRRARAGDSTSVGVLYSRYFDCVYDFLLRTLRDPAAAEDAAQDTFVKVVQSLDGLASVDSFKSWLFTVARRTALNNLRSARPTISLTAPLDHDDCHLDVVDEDRFGDPAAVAEAAALGSVVWAAAAGLDPGVYTVLDMHLRQGFDSPEIAQALGISRNHAAVKLNRVKTSMRRSVTALYMLETGRRHCTALDAELQTAGSGAFTPALRKEIERHIAGCSTCQQSQMKVVSPESVFSALAVIPVGVSLLPKIALTLGISAAAAGASAGAAGTGGAAAGAGTAGGGVASAPVAIAASIAALVVGSALAALAIFDPFGGPSKVVGPALVEAVEAAPSSVPPSSPTPQATPATVVAEVVVPALSTVGLQQVAPIALVSSTPEPPLPTAKPRLPTPEATPPAAPSPPTPPAPPPPLIVPPPPPIPPALDPPVIQALRPPETPAPPSPSPSAAPKQTPSSTPTPPAPAQTATPTPSPSPCLPAPAQATVCPPGRADGAPGKSGEPHGKNGKGNSGEPPGQASKP